ncbi:hypothetical protein AURDEDRAFT_172959 [Auricularia subglabra TFB-10046 SS5]|uniref:Uncharacterized protein n=1 Tax=Auricularia subglabra (strain TFB-10046 / SS5) TaxID=717982 RepID=J0D0T5_AURST|nr:hypothetical protein AURDEDRAFT_172959 [Auricularia subglabra TFB-10046 SS5]
MSNPNPPNAVVVPSPVDDGEHDLPALLDEDGDDQPAAVPNDVVVRVPRKTTICGPLKQFVLVAIAVPPSIFHVSCTTCGATGEALETVVRGATGKYVCRLERTDFAVHNKDRERFFSYVSTRGRPVAGILPPPRQFRVSIYVLNLANTFDQYRGTLSSPFFTYADLPAPILSYLGRSRPRKGIELVIPDNIVADPRIRIIDPLNIVGIWIGRPEKLHMRIIWAEHPGLKTPTASGSGSGSGSGSSSSKTRAGTSSSTRVRAKATASTKARASRRASSSGSGSTMNDPIVIEDDEPSAASGDKRKRASAVEYPNKKLAV